MGFYMVIAGLVGSVLGGIFLDKFHKFKRGFDSDLSKIIMMKMGFYKILFQNQVLYFRFNLGPVGSYISTMNS